MTRAKLGECKFCGEPCYREAYQHRECMNRARRVDAEYRRWLTDIGNRDFIPNEQALAVIEAAMDKYDTMRDLCEAAGVQERRVYDVRNKGRGMEYRTAAKVAMEAGMLAEFEAMTMRQFGRDEWSPLGRYCGDGAPGRLIGCGTFAHPYHGKGLCEECYGREVLGFGPTEPRDVRWAVTR